MTLNLHLLRLFVAVAQHQSFSAAAIELGISQPAVSKGVREFEAQIGLPLLERGVRKVRPTELGQRLVSQAQSLFAAERAAEEELEAARGLRRGVLAIGASTTIATYLLPSIIGAFHKRYPSIELHLTSANTRAIADQVCARSLDVALVEGPTNLPHLIAQPWLQDEMVLIAAPGHRLMRQRHQSISHALADEIFLLREPGSGTREVVASALQTYAIKPRTIIEIGSTEAIKQMVAAGYGVAIVSAAAAADQIMLGRLAIIRPDGFRLRRILTRLTVRDRQPPAAATAFNVLLDSAKARIKASI